MTIALNNKSFVQQLAEMPLEDYMSTYPDRLERLKNRLAVPCGTYGETAVVIHQMMKDDENCDRLSDVLEALAIPIVAEYIVDFTEMGPEDMDGNPVESVKELMARIAREDPFIYKMLHISLEDYLREAHMVDDIGIVEEFCDVPVEVSSFASTLYWLYTVLDKSEPDSLEREDAVSGLHTLLIAPFALMEYESVQKKGEYHNDNE